MAVANCKSIEPVHQYQPDHESDHESLAMQMDRCLMVLNVAERLHIMSESMMDGIAEGESYESLVRGLECLHHQLKSLAKVATAAKVTPL